MLEEQLVIDSDAYIQTLTMQRNSAMDVVARLEGVISTLRKENTALKEKLEAATIKTASTNMYTTHPPESSPAN